MITLPFVDDDGTVFEMNLQNIKTVIELVPQAEKKIVGLDGVPVNRKRYHLSMFEFELTDAKKVGVAAYFSEAWLMAQGGISNESREARDEFVNARGPWFFSYGRRMVRP